MRAALAALWIVLAPSGAWAQVSVDGRPATPVPGMFESTDVVEVYEERTRFKLDSAERVDLPAVAGVYTSAPATRPEIPAGTTLACYLVHYEGTYPVSGTVQLSPGVRLLGIVAGEGLLDRWDALCAPAYPVAYPSADSGRGALGGGDTITVGDDLQTVTLDFVEGSSDTDQVRILIASVEEEDAGVRAPDAGAAAERDAGAAAERDAGAAAVSTTEWDYRGGGGCRCSAAGARGGWGGAVGVAVLFGVAVRRARRTRRVRRACRARRALGRRAE